MEVRINKEIQSYSESLFFGLSLRQCGFSLATVLVAVGLYFLLQPYVGTETVSWMCILSVPRPFHFAALGSTCSPMNAIERHSDYLEIGSRFARVLYLKDYASYIRDGFVSELTDLNRDMMLSIDLVPVPTEEAVREVENRLLGVETNITNWQQKQNQNNNFSVTVPYDMELQRTDGLPGHIRSHAEIKELQRVRAVKKAGKPRKKRVKKSGTNTA